MMSSMKNVSSLDLHERRMMHASAIVIDSDKSALKVNCENSSGNKMNLGKGGEELVITNSVDVAARDWRKLFATNSDQSLQFFPPQISDGKIIVEPPAEIFDEGVDCWKNAVIGQFIGQMPNFSLLQRLVNILWGADGEVNVRPAGSNLFLIQFPNSIARDRVLETGPWHIQNKPLILRKWEPGMETLEFNFAKLPI